jgi:hypothetical protein
MDKALDEMKNRISLALKDPILQQGFEIICKRLSILEKDVRGLEEDKHELLKKTKCCENCKYKGLDYSFSPICISRGWDNIRGIGGNPLTFKCDEWEKN